MTINSLDTMNWEERFMAAFRAVLTLEMRCEDLQKQLNERGYFCAKKKTDVTICKGSSH